MVHAKDGMLSIHKALMFARSDIVDKFLSIDENLIQIPYRDIPITHLALSLAGFESFREQCILCLNLLLRYGANVHAVDRVGRTLLHWASFYKMTSLCEMLLARGLKIEKEDYGQMNSIDICISKDNEETLEFFVFFVIYMV